MSASAVASSVEDVQRSRGPSGTQAIDRALDVLNAFAQSDAELGVIEIAERCGLNPSTVHRIVRALVSKGFLEQREPNGRYYLGRSTMLLGQLAQRRLGFGRAMPHLEALARRWDESVNLGYREGNNAVVVLRVESPQPLRFEQPVGTRVGLHFSAMGKCLLAFTPDIEVAVAELGDLQRRTSRTITDPTRLCAELERVRERGFSVDEQEALEGVRCIGAPVLGGNRLARAAIALQAPVSRMGEARVPEIAESVMGAADDIARDVQKDLAHPW